MADYASVCGWEYCDPSPAPGNQLRGGGLLRPYDEGGQAWSGGTGSYGSGGFAGGSNRPIAVYIAEASRHFAIPARWIEAVIHAESRGGVYATSPKGAMGLMQIMPATWETLRARYGLGPDPYDPHDNIVAGTAYLRELLDVYGSPGFLAAYNSGPARYEEYLATGQPLPSETVEYADSIAPFIGGNAAFRGRWNW